MKAKSLYTKGLVYLHDKKFYLTGQVWSHSIGLLKQCKNGKFQQNPSSRKTVMIDKVSTPDSCLHAIVSAMESYTKRKKEVICQIGPRWVFSGMEILKITSIFKAVSLEDQGECMDPA